MTQISTWLPNLRALNNHSAIRGFRKSFWGFADQALISGTNFILMVLLARQLGPTAFGAFVVAYTVLMFANSIQGPLFTAPHNVLGATRTGPAYAHYTTTTAIAQTVFSCAAGLVIGSIAMGAFALAHHSAWLLLALAPTCIAWQIQEFIRRVLYTNSDYTGAFHNDGITYGGQIVGVVLLIGIDRLNTVSAVLVIGAASLVGAVIGGWRIRPFLTRTLDQATAAKELKENWIFGRWLLGSSLTSWVSGQLYPLLTAGFVGVAATGGLRAAQTMVAPTHVLLRSMDSMIPSRAARIYSTEGVHGLRRHLRRFGVPGAVLMVVYCGFIVIFARPLVVLVLGHDFEAYVWLVRVSAVSYLLVYTSTVASLALRSVGKTAPMFYAYLYSSVLVLTLGVAGVYFYGLEGAAIGIVLHIVTLNIVLWHYVCRL